MATLYAPESYWRYRGCNPEILTDIVNGCGPAGWKSSLIPDTIWGVSIQEACNIHDFMYHFGVNEFDREEADRVFCNNMLRIVEAESANAFMRWLRRSRVLKYYGIVRDMGGTYFWVDKNSGQTFKDPMEVMAAS